MDRSAWLTSEKIQEIYGGESYPVITLQILIFGASISLNISYMLKLRAERSRTGGNG